MLENKKNQPHLIEPYCEINFENAVCKVPDFIMPHLNPVMDPVTGNMLEYRQPKGPDRNKWIQSLVNDLGRLAQGLGTRLKK